MCCDYSDDCVAPRGPKCFYLDESVAFFKLGESNPTQPNPPTTSSAAHTPCPPPETRPQTHHAETPTNPRHPQPPPTRTTTSPPSRGHQEKPHYQTPQATTTTTPPNPHQPPQSQPAPPAAASAEPYALHNPAAVRQHLRGLGDQEVLRLHTCGTTQRIRTATLLQAATLGEGVRDFLFDAFLHVARLDRPALATPDGENPPPTGSRIWVLPIDWVRHLVGHPTDPTVRLAGVQPLPALAST